MKLKLNSVLIIVGTIVIIAVCVLLYQQSRINNCKKELKEVVSKHIEKFAGMAGNIDNETAFIQQYGSIVAAQEAYIVFSEENSIPNDEWNYSLPNLFIQIKFLMLNDKEKFKEAFQDTDGSKLLFEISDNFEDIESREKLYNLIK